MRYIVSALLIPVCVVAAPVMDGSATDIPYFETDALPILQRNCVSCHGVGTPQAGLVLATYEGIIKGSTNGQVIVPFKPLQSRLVRMISGLHETVMPPDPVPRLGLDDADRLVRWIAYGALSRGDSEHPEAGPSHVSTRDEDRPALALLQQDAIAGPYFDTDVLPILERHCLVCHGRENPLGTLSLATYAGAMVGSATGKVVVPGRESVSPLVRAVLGTDGRVMPPDPLPRLSDTESAVIRQWVKNGAQLTRIVGWPEVDAHDSGEASAAPLFETSILPILKERCVGCHGGKEPKSGLYLGSYDGVMKGGTGGRAIAVGDSQKSHLYKRITGQANPRMPASPFPALREDQIAAIREWIDNGAPTQSARQRQ